jgi:hypothetical protein
MRLDALLKVTRKAALVQQKDFGAALCLLSSGRASGIHRLLHLRQWFEACR